MHACMGREKKKKKKNHRKTSHQVVREVSGQSAGPEESTSPVIPRKTELDKVGVNHVQAGSWHFRSRIIAIDRWGEEKQQQSSSWVVTNSFKQPFEYVGLTLMLVLEQEQRKAWMWFYGTNYRDGTGPVVFKHALLSWYKLPRHKQKYRRRKKESLWN